jgi:hypothetical protein
MSSRTALHSVLVRRGLPDDEMPDAAPAALTAGGEAEDMIPTERDGSRHWVFWQRCSGQVTYLMSLPTAREMAAGA